MLAALVAASGVLAALEWLVYGARVLPRSPTVAILARVEWAYMAVLGTAIGLMLCEIIWNMVKYVRAWLEAFKELT